jgi:hypothetical protein
MTLPWYWPLIQDLRKHIEDNHLDLRGALDEIDFTEEYLHYESFTDGEDVSIKCPFSIHCSCDWNVSAHIEFKLVESNKALVPGSDLE